MSPQTNSYTNQPASSGSKLRIGRILIVLILVLGFVGGGTFAYLKLNNQKKELEQQKIAANTKIQELEAKLNQAQSSSSEDEEQTQTATQSKTTPTDRDITEINKLLDSRCPNADAPEITKAQLQTADSFGAQRFYNGYAQIGTSCASDNGGYISFMQRQTNLSWKELFGAQDIPGCELANQYKIPSQILPNCISTQTQTTIPNTN